MALPNDDSKNFAVLIAKVKATKDSDPKLAISILEEIEVNLPNYSLNEQINFYVHQAELYNDLAEYYFSRTAAEQGLALTQQLSTPSILISELNYSLGFALESLGDFDGAQQNYFNGLEVAESLGDKAQIGYALLNIGAIYYQTEQYEKALTVLKEALISTAELDNNELKGNINIELGNLYGILSDNVQSIAFYETAYEQFMLSGSKGDALVCLSNIAAMYAIDERYDEAIEKYEKIISQSEQIANIELVYSVHMGISWAYAKSEPSNPEAALHHLLVASEYVGDLQQKNLPVYFLIEKARILDSMQRFDEALDNLAEVQMLLANDDYQVGPWAELNVIRLKTMIYNDLGRFEEAYNLLTEYMTKAFAVTEAENVNDISNLKAKFDSEQADFKTALLENQHEIEDLALKNSQQMSANKQKYFLLISVVAVVFLWLFYRLLRNQKALLHLSRTDTLTGLLNRRRLTNLGMKLTAKAKKSSTDLSILAIDCDNFKMINDQHGHAVGDEVLKIVAQSIQRVVGNQGLVGRMGGEEFSVILPQMSQKNALRLAEQIRQDVDKQSYHHVPITISIGLCSKKPEEKVDFEILYKRADMQLLTAKVQGRNKVCV